MLSYHWQKREMVLNVGVQIGKHTSLETSSPPHPVSYRVIRQYPLPVKERCLPFDQPVISFTVSYCARTLAEYTERCGAL